MKITLTGGAGSLGRAFVRYLHPNHELVVLDHNEWASAELQSQYPTLRIRLQDIADYRFDDAPDAMIHLAAYKHVNLGESNPETFIANNVTKTADLFRRAKEMATKILFISTDKAVEPMSVYGCTKYLGERLAWHNGGQVARLGNILNSSGSVIPVWEAAIAENKPIPITNPAMTRYLIEEDSAVRQIWHGFMNGKRLIVPDMGDPITLLQLLGQVMKKHGYRDIREYKPGTTVIGIRPGEKMNEKLRWEWEETHA